MISITCPKKRKRKKMQLKNKLLKLGFQENQILRLNHHLCHASAVYYGLAQKLDEKYLVFTLDGGGDMETDTVSYWSQCRIRKANIILFLFYRKHVFMYNLFFRVSSS